MKKRNKIIAILNQKGGIGKTTLSHNLATSMSIKKKKVLLIDNDPQGSLSLSVGLEPEELKVTISEVLCDAVNINNSIIKFKNFDFIASNNIHADTELRLFEMKEKEYILSMCIEELEEEYDYIIIDNPPSLGILTINALVCATDVLIPVGMELLSIHGLQAVRRTIEKIKINLNKDLNILGVVPTFFDGRTTLSKETLDLLKDSYDYYIFKEVGISVKVKESILISKCIVEFKPYHPISYAYKNIANDIIKRK